MPMPLLLQVVASNLVIVTQIRMRVSGPYYFGSGARCRTDIVDLSLRASTSKNIHIVSCVNKAYSRA
jgi:hypothetical protein